MKKLISILLVFLMVMPTMVFADSNASEDLERVLVAVKSKIDIPSEFTVFESNITTYNNKTEYNFSWWTPSDDKSIRIGADEEGHIIFYNSYTDDRTEKMLSGVSKKDIISFAEEFVKKAIPEMYTDSTDVLVFDEDSYSVGSYLRYSLVFKRNKNGIFVKDNIVEVIVSMTDDEELYISNMSVNLDYKTPFADRKEDLPDYVEKYKETFPIELVYRNEYNPDWKEEGKDKYTGVLIYRMENNNAGFISMETGKIVVEDKGDDVIYRDETIGGEMMDSTNKSESPLTPEEMKEITNVEGLLSIEEIEAKVKKLPYIKFPAGVVLKHSTLSKDDADKYVYNLSYSSENDYLHMSVYAKDGKLISFYRSEDQNKRNKDIPESQMDGAKQNVEKFLTAVAEDEFSETRLQENVDREGFAHLYYYRRIEGVKNINEGISVIYDDENQMITSFSLTFTNTEFPSPHNTMLHTVAYDKMLEHSPIVKMYVKSDGKYVLCATIENRNIIIEAFTGENMNASKGKKQSFAYSDIDGHWVEDEAITLSEIQLGFDGGKLNPDEKITQEDFLRFMASGIYGKYYHKYETDELYENLIYGEIISEDEKNPSATITREDAFVCIIRMAELEKVAKLENIYKVEFADGNLLSEGKIGYCAILSGMGVVCGDGGYLRPQDDLTYAEAVIMLYRYLSKG